MTSRRPTYRPPVNLPCCAAEMSVRLSVCLFVRVSPSDLSKYSALTTTTTITTSTAFTTTTVTASGPP
ncbi:hypothetical protein E2C01_007977 [Portunus trituberculatus]|uniref:Uncharacterized protein n=1 Tax=Portunus trituberculatus TaxID=210409 RepID=A0A5B7D2P4_PORTR|nr:hypothetical protein [Portunus trituberculatus]